MAVKIQFRRDTAANWAAVPTTVLSSGEVGYESDTGNIKIGDGTTQWQNLAYYQLPNVSVDPATTVDLNNVAYRTMGRYRLNSVTGTPFTNAPSDIDSDANSYSTLVVTTHFYSGASPATLTQQTLTQYSDSAVVLKQWVRIYNGTDWTAWSSTAHLTDSEVTTVKIADATSTTTGVTNAKFRHSAALSVVGRSANSTGAPADISTSSSSDAVLRESGGTVGFGTVATAGIADDAVTADKLRDDASTDANRAVTTNHIRNGAVTSAKLETNISISGTLSVGSTTTFTGAPSYAADPGSGNVLARKTYVDDRTRIGAVAFVMVANAVIQGQSTSGQFSITSNQIRGPAGQTWYGALCAFSSSVNSAFYGNVTSSSGVSVATGNASMYLYVLVRTA